MLPAEISTGNKKFWEPWPSAFFRYPNHYSIIFIRWDILRRTSLYHLFSRRQYVFHQFTQIQCCARIFASQREVRAWWVCWQLWVGGCVVPLPSEVGCVGHYSAGNAGLCARLSRLCCIHACICRWQFFWSWISDLYSQSDLKAFEVAGPIQLLSTSVMLGAMLAIQVRLIWWILPWWS